MRRGHMDRLWNERRCRLLPLHRGDDFVSAPQRQGHESGPLVSGTPLERGRPKK